MCIVLDNSVFVNFIYNAAPSVHSLIHAFFSFAVFLLQRTSDGGNGNHSVSLPIILIKIKVGQMLPSS